MFDCSFTAGSFTPKPTFGYENFGGSWEAKLISFIHGCPYDHQPIGWLRMLADDLDMQ